MWYFEVSVQNWHTNTDTEYVVEANESSKINKAKQRCPEPFYIQHYHDVPRPKTNHGIRHITYSEYIKTNYAESTAHYPTPSAVTSNRPVRKLALMWPDPDYQIGPAPSEVHICA